MIDVLMALHNGEHYLKQMLASLHEQTYRDLTKLLLYDDFSVDKTVAIIDAFSEIVKMETRYNKKISLGACNCFSQLLQISKAEYVMFCDQDDVWFSDKIEKTFNKMQESEGKFGKECPLLVFTDLCITDKNLSVINNSYFRYQKLNPTSISLNRLLLQNVASGCTVMANRALVDLASPIPQEAVMHDHWFSLVAAAFGQIVYLDESTIYYRQHEKNFYGASSYGWGYFYKRYKTGLDKVRERLYQNIAQAQAFLERYRESLPDETITLLEDIVTIREKNWVERRRILLKHKIYKSGLRRNLGTMLII